MALTVKGIASKSKPGRYSDGNGLYLHVTAGKSGRVRKSWVQRIVVNGRRIDRGLGSVRWLSLSQARDLALQNRLAARRGENPFGEGRPAVTVPTFQQAAQRALDHLRGTLTAKTADDWLLPVDRYCAAWMDRPVNEITKLDVLGVLLPIWTDKHNTARKLRQKLSAIFTWAVGNDHARENAANGELDGVLPKVKRETTNYKAIDWRAVPDAFRKIATVKASESALAALRFAILTAVRSDEARSATWDQVDFDARVWTATVKGGKEHRVPLTDAALAILRAQQGQHAEYVFPSPQTHRALSPAAFGRILRAAGIDSTTHGFRSCFSTWANDATDHDHQTIEVCLAHTVGNQVAQSYNRGDRFEKRRALMVAWSAHVTG